MAVGGPSRFPGRIAKMLPNCHVDRERVKQGFPHVGSKDIPRPRRALCSPASSSLA